MADYSTRVSFIIPLSSEQLEFALEVAKCFEDENLDLTNPRNTKAARAYDKDVYRIARRLARRVDDYDPDYPSLEFFYMPHETGFWITDRDGSINTEDAAIFTQLILKHFDIEGFVAIEASNTCSQPTLDAYGGHAYLITKKHLRWMGTHYWIDKQTERLGLKEVSSV